MVKPAAGRVPRIHAVTNEEVLGSPDFVTRARALMEALGTQVAIHIRAPAISAAILHRIVEELVRAQEETESWLVVNDRIDIALATGARGVQLTSRSIGVRDAVCIANGLKVGASIHSVPQAMAAHSEGAHWLVAGNVYTTETHKGADGRGEDFIAAVAWHVPTPVIAIGGILPHNVPALRIAGAHGVAAIRGIWQARDAALAAAGYLSSYDSDGDS